LTTNKILCIKDYNEELWFSFKNGNTYEISYKDVHVCIYDDDRHCLRYNKYSFFGEDTVQEYFITLKELRKQKLEKLNGKMVNK